MGDMLASALVDSLVKYITNAAVEQIGLVSAFQTNLHSLKSTFEMIQPVLQDAEIKQWNNDDIRVWLRDLQDAALDVENVLDEVATEVLRQQAQDEIGKSSLCFNNSWSFRFKMANKVKTVEEKLTKIVEQSVKFNLRVRHHGFLYRETCLLVIESEIVGRKDDQEMIVRKLLDENLEQSHLSVYSIWGMGGLGKTTLAQLVYNDEDVVKHFELRIWVCVSEEFNVKRLLKEMIESIDGSECNISGLDPLQRDLREKLMRKKFLLVLDDVWNEKEMKWDELKKILSCGSKGSVVMVTTRIEKIASMMSNVGTYALEILSDEDSWCLFTQRAFPTGQEVDESLASIGKKIVKKCGGIALAIKALGGVMRSKPKESEWLEVVNNEIWNVLDNKDGISPALRLSYYYLPPYMRQCFAYCCIFPKDKKMSKEELIQLWMANGFVPSDGSDDLYVSGHSIFKELTWRSFFQDIETDDSGTTTCKMHNLMHDLAKSIMGQDVHILSHQNVLEISKPLHLVCSKDCAIKFNKSSGNSIRTFIVNDPRCIGGDFISFISREQYLRVLRSDYHSNELWNLAYKFKHLRFLLMSCCKRRILPESLTRLYNLQTLKLIRSSELRELPKQLKLMKNLYFLEMDNTVSLLYTPPELGKLSLLRRLSIFIVGEDSSQQINQLKDLNLGGELTIRGLNNVSGFEDAKNANLMQKSDLTSLVLDYTRNRINQSPSDFDSVLQGLQPHPNLERILIRGFPGSNFSHWLSDSLYTNLKEIELVGNKRCEHLPPMGNLPSLTSLRLDHLDSVKCLGSDFHGNKECPFPALKRLEIRFMTNLKEWVAPELKQSYPCLIRLTIEYCPKLGNIPSLPSIKDLSINRSNVALLSPVNNLTSLETLELDFDNDYVDVFSDDNLLKSNTTLKSLTLQGSGVKSVPNMLNNLSALKSLRFAYCEDLEIPPKDLSKLTSLETLAFSYCKKLKEFPAAVLEGLPSLVSLEFSNCEELEVLCGALEKPSPLHVLKFQVLPKLRCFPGSMRQLTALKVLTIWHCIGLLPLELKLLNRDNCSKKLEKRCRKENVEDWQKISHIPTIIINDQVIQSVED